jgi:hypothetical protein
MFDGLGAPPWRWQLPGGAELQRGRQSLVSGRGRRQCDDTPDLAVANAGSNNVSVLINKTPMAKQRSNGKK